MPPTSRAPSAERPQPGAFAAQLQEACEGGSCDCSDDSLADSEDDEDIAEDEARQFTESRSVEADQVCWPPWHMMSYVTVLAGSTNSPTMEVPPRGGALCRECGCAFSAMRRVQLRCNLIR